MELASPWLLLITLVILGVSIAAGILLGRRDPAARPGTDPVAVSRTDRLRSLPRFTSVVRTHTRLLAGVLVLGFVAIIFGGILVARPTTESVTRPLSHNRDIMLCLDVSGSMTDVDAEVIDTFLELSKGFDGERIGLTIFNSSAAQVFPLTDDYTLVREQLTAMRRSLTDDTSLTPDYWKGTLNGTGASLIGDGLAACALRFDHIETDRSRSLIFATDNEEYGASIVSLEEAAGYATNKQIRVFTLNPVDGNNAGNTDRLRAATESTGGAYYPLRATTAVSDIIAQVQSSQARALRGEPRVIRTDDPALWSVALLIAGGGFVVLVWRFRL